MKSWLFMLALAPASYANAHAGDPLQGKVVGFVHKDHPLAADGNFCYIAISAAASPFDNTYLRIEDSGTCRLAQAAYQLGEPVKVIADLSNDLAVFIPVVKSLELKRDDRPHAFRDPRSQALEKAYDMNGPLSGYKAGDKGSCDIAITTKDSRYTDAYHYVEDRRMCELAFMNYVLRSAVSATAASRNATVKEIITLEVTRGGVPYVPPYHVTSALDHYALSGPVGGYKLSKKGPPCFASIKSDAPYGNGYHTVKDRSTCNVLLSAYFSGSPIAVGVRSGTGFNQIVRVDLATDHKAYWPPYDSAPGKAEGANPNDKKDELK